MVKKYLKAHRKMVKTTFQVFKHIFLLDNIKNK